MNDEEIWTAQKWMRMENEVVVVGKGEICPNVLICLFSAHRFCRVQHIDGGNGQCCWCWVKSGNQQYSSLAAAGEDNEFRSLPFHSLSVLYGPSGFAANSLSTGISIRWLILPVCSTLDSSSRGR
jgi:hypothetical protein